MKSTIKLGKQTGSFMNFMMGNNRSLPEVGKGATLLHWTDRTACQVIEVSADKRRAVIEEFANYKAEELSGYRNEIVWRNNAWRKVISRVVFESDEAYEKWRAQPESERNKLYDEDACMRVIEGLTKVKYEYPKVNIIWGVIDPYYDPSF
jgi:heme-degrading monooxygenase HmoA